MQVRPRRSVLYMPGLNERALDKARTIPADSLILDLEDSVAPESKAAARASVCTAVKSGGYGRRELVIRPNAIETAWGMDDLRAAVSVAPDAILVPKVSQPGLKKKNCSMSWPQKRSPLRAKHRVARWGSDISTCSSSAG